MTEPRMADVLTAISALRDTLVEKAGAIASVAQTEREIAASLRESGYLRLATKIDQCGATNEMNAGELAAGLERLGQIIGDVKGETLAETLRMSQGSVAAAKDS